MGILINKSGRLCGYDQQIITKYIKIPCLDVPQHGKLAPNPWHCSRKTTWGWVGPRASQRLGSVDALHLLPCRTSATGNGCQMLPQPKKGRKVNLNPKHSGISWDYDVSWKCNGKQWSPRKWLDLINPDFFTALIWTIKRGDICWVTDTMTFRVCSESICRKLWPQKVGKNW